MQLAHLFDAATYHGQCADELVPGATHRHDPLHARRVRYVDASTALYSIASQPLNHLTVSQ